MAQGRRDRFSQGAAPRGRAIPVLLLGSMLLSTGVAQAAPAHDAAGAVPVAVPAGSKCDRTKFRIILDVGHTAESYGAMSARNVPEFEYNLNLGKRIDERLKVDGFTETVLLVTEGKARPSLAARVARANRRDADLFVSIHHDSVPGIYVEKWEFEGKKGAFNDMFGGYSVFVSKQNPHYAESLRFARLLGNQMAAKDLQFARQYDQWFMGKFQRELLDIEALTRLPRTALCDRLLVAHVASPPWRAPSYGRRRHSDVARCSTFRLGNITSGNGVRTLYSSATNTRSLGQFRHVVAALPSGVS